MGGMGFCYECEARISGARMAPPPQDPHLYRKAKRGKKEKEADVPNAPGPSDREKSIRMELRGRSCMRYRKFRKNLGRTALTRERPSSRYRR